MLPRSLTACSSLPPAGYSDCPELVEGWGGPAEKGFARTRTRGFTLLELMVVVAIIALATASVSFALRDSSQVQLEREAERLAALLESARAQSRASGVAVRWHSTADGFQFDGLPAQALPQHWLGPDTRVRGAASVQLGPEPIIGPQAIVLSTSGPPERALRVATDGLRPFTVQAAP